MGLNSNNNTKILDREAWNESSATRISSGAKITNFAGNLFLVETTGYIKKTLEDTVPVSVEETMLNDIQEVTLEDGSIDTNYDGIIAIVITVESEVKFIAVPSITTEVNTALYIQLAVGYRNPLDNSISRIEYKHNCVLGDDIATTVKEFAEAVGRISNLKIRPSSNPDMPLSIETYIEEDERLSRFLYGSNSLRSFEENISIRHKTSQKKEHIHRPLVEEGLVDTFFAKQMGTDQNYQLNATSDQPRSDAGRIRINKFLTTDDQLPTGVLGNDEWMIVAVDMREADDTKVAGADTDVSFLLSYDTRLFRSRKEAYENRSIVDKTTNITRLGWVIFCGSTKKLELDDSLSWVGSTDYFGIQVIKPPYFSDIERAGNLSPAMAREYIFNRDGTAVLDRKGNALVVR